MTAYIPITLVGNCLGERHRYLNSLVNDAYRNKVPFESIQVALELSAVDHLFKIDYASKLRHTDYILSNLKNDDMLYVSRALQCSWLLEPQYHDFINPRYLEEVLYPEMTTTAVNKMNNWLYVNLKDPSRCSEFFQYYSLIKGDLAFKFLWNCPEDIIVDAVAKEPKKITPKRLELLCEKCPRAVRAYFEIMVKDNAILDQYLKDEGHYYRCLTTLINTDPDLLLDIAEKYFNRNCCDTFSSKITRTIMVKHKDRYISKPELYAGWLLHVPTLAESLCNDEIKDIVLRLARAKYLGASFFSYKLVEPLIKQLSQNEMSNFKKIVFVDKCIGEEVKDWPYEPPSSPHKLRNYERHVFDDVKFKPRRARCEMNCDFRSKLKKRKFAKYFRPEETLLDKLFIKYRCISFKKTLYELGKQILAESSVQTRQYMMLVLVSKTGGRFEYVKDLLELLVSRHNNEAKNLRATIVRSLIKRAKAWRLPDDLWQMLLKFAHGLGLDGEISDENCCEGLHAVVLRNILTAEECSPKIFAAYMKQFSTFAEYSLNENEIQKVGKKLPFLVLASAKEQSEVKEAVIRVEAVMKVLNDYKLNIKHCPAILIVIIALARQDSEACLGLLKPLYTLGLARKDLCRENFTFLQSNEAYLNVLRHDSQFLTVTDKFETLASEKINHDQFLRKLAIYFSENQGLAENYLNIIRREITKMPRTDLVRSFAILAGSSLYTHLQEVDRVVEKTIEQKRLAVALRTYGHLARPKLDLVKLGWRSAGVKAVANQISICRAKKVEEYMSKLLDWPRAPKLSFLLAERINREVEILPMIAYARPTVAIKITLRYLKQRGEGVNPKVWETAKVLLEHIDLSDPKYSYVRDRLSEVAKMPENLRVDYGVIIYKVFRKISVDDGMQVLIDIEKYLSKANEKFLVDEIQEFLDNELTYEKVQKLEYLHEIIAHLNIRLIAKYLLLCKSEDTRKQRIDNIGKRFLTLMKTFYDKTDSLESRDVFLQYWNSFMFNLKNTNVFMDTSYVSCLPVLQHIAEWLRETVSIVEHVDIFATMHLIMLYYKAIRQSIKHNPLIFSDKSKRNQIGVEIVGVVYGKYISHELIQLKTEYFDSIVEIYTKVLIAFLSAVFPFGKSFSRFVSALIRGISGEKDSTSLLLSEKVFIEYRYSLQELDDDKPLGLLKGHENKQLKFFLNADMPDIFAEDC